MVRLRPPGEGERLCTPWVLLSDLEFLGIVAFENFWAIFGFTCREAVGIELRESHTPTSGDRSDQQGRISPPFCIVVGEVRYRVEEPELQASGY